MCGIIFGFCVWVVMHYVILPASLVRMGPGPQLGWPLVNMLGIHMFGVGVPIALITAYRPAARNWGLTLAASMVNRPARYQ